MIRMLQDYVKKSKGSLALIFVDAKQAFYEVIRQLVVPIHESDEAVAWMFSRLKLPPQALHKLVQHLQQGPSMPQTQVPQPIQG